MKQKNQQIRKHFHEKGGCCFGKQKLTTWMFNLQFVWHCCNSPWRHGCSTYCDDLRFSFVTGVGCG